MDVQLDDIVDAALIGGLKAVFLGPVSPYLFAILGIAVGSAILEKWLIKRRREGAAKTVKTGAYLLGGVMTLTAFLKAVRHVYGIITFS